MLRFNHGKIDILNQVSPKFIEIIGHYAVLIADIEIKTLKYYKDLFSKKNNLKVSIDGHAFDVILPMIKDHEAFSVYLMLNRLADRGVITTSINDLCNKLQLESNELLASLSILEENLLISISGNKLLKIKLNENWI